MPDTRVKMGVPAMIMTLIILVAIALGMYYLGIGKKVSSSVPVTDSTSGASSTPVADSSWKTYTDNTF